MLHSEEIRSFRINKKLSKNDKIEVEVGFYTINPKIAKKLNIKTKYIKFKKVVF